MEYFPSFTLPRAFNDGAMLVRFCLAQHSLSPSSAATLPPDSLRTPKLTGGGQGSWMPERSNAEKLPFRIQGVLFDGRS